MKIETSVILIAKNTSDPIFPKCIAALKNIKRAGIELIVVDNGSSQRSIKLIKNELLPERLVCNDQNFGVAGAFNIGASLAKGATLIFVTHDVIINSNCLENIVTTITSNKSYGPVGCKLLYPDGLHIQHAGAYLDYPRCMGFHLGRFEQDRGQFDKPGFVNYVTGAIFGVSNKLWKEVGGFDDGFYPAYYEDSDFCFRLNQKGYKSYYQPKAIAIHGENSSTKKAPEIRLHYLHQNRFRYLLKHFPLNELVDRFVPEELRAFINIKDEPERKVLWKIYKEGDNYNFGLGKNKERKITELFTRLRFVASKNFNFDVNIGP